MSGVGENRASAEESSKSAFTNAACKRSPKAKRPSPVSIRFSAEELERLRAEAGSRSLNGYIRSRLFGSTTKVLRAPSSAKPDTALLSRLLRNLGDWDLTWALKELELGVNEGVILLDVDTCAALRGACTDIAAMRQDLTRALGLRDPKS